MNHLKCSIPPPDIGGLYFLIQNKSKRAVEIFSSPFLLPFDTFSRTAGQCENGIAVYCFSIEFPQKAKKRVQNYVLDPSMTSRIVYCPSTLLFLFLTFPLCSIKGDSKKVNFQT